MKNFVITCLLLTASAVIAASAVLPWSDATNAASRFKANTSGQMTVSDDADQKAVRFDVQFKPGTDFWVYPVLTLKDGESLADVDRIRFEFKAVQGNPEAKYTAAYVMFGNEKPYYTLPTPSAEYQIVTIDVAKAVKDPAAVKAIKIGINPKDAKLTFWIKNLQFFTGKPEAATDAAAVIRCAAPAAAFLQDEELKFTLDPQMTPVKWTLKDWQNKVLQEGQWPASGELVLAALPNGYYQIELTGDGKEFTNFRSFTVVPDPAKRPANPDMFFAMDSAQSWLARPDAKNPRQPSNAFEVTSEAARRAGIQSIRERLSWAATEPAPGNFNWAQYKTNADLLAARGIKISGMYHDAPQWAKTNTARLPGDLLAAYHFAKKLNAEFHGQMTDWEFWNEQDIGFAPEGAWDYAAAFKAASLGFKAEHPDFPVAVGGFAITNVGPYADTVMANDAGEYFDIFNIHTYAPIKDYPALLQAIKALLGRHQLGDKPIWFTENGSNMEGSGRLASYMPGIRMHSFDQELLVAEFLPKMMIAMQSLGVSRDFFFVLPPYNEGGGNKDWGLMRRDFTVKPGYTAFATLADQLGRAKLLGQVDLGKEIKGYLYRQPDGGKTLVYWSISPLDTESGRPNLSTGDLLRRTFALPGAARKVNGVDLFGTPFTADSDQLTATRFPAFVNGAGDLKLSVPFEAPAAGKSKADAALDKTIIFRTELSDAFPLFAGKDSVDVKTADAKFKLQIWNLSNEAKTGSVAVTGGKVTGLPASVIVPAFGKTELALGFTPDIDKSFKGALRVNGEFNGRRTTGLVIPIQSMQAMIDSGRKVEMPQMVDPANWRKNSSGTQTITYDTKEQAIVVQTKFPAGVDRWSYPEYVLQLPQESLEKALGIGFEVKVAKAADIKQMLVMAVTDKQKEGGKSANLPVVAPTDTWQERFVQFPIGYDAGKVEQLRIGVNANADDVTVMIRNIKIYYAP